MHWLQLAGKHFVHYHEKTAVLAQLFAELFGTTPVYCTKVWIMLHGIRWVQNSSLKITPVHLLWALFFLRHYLTTALNAAIVGVSAKTFQEKTWYVIFGLSELHDQLVSLQAILIALLFMCISVLKNFLLGLLAESF